MEINELQVVIERIEKRVLSLERRIGVLERKVDPLIEPIMTMAREWNERKAMRDWINRCFASGKRIISTLIGISLVIGALSALIQWGLTHWK